MEEKEKQDLYISVVQAHKGIIYKVANAYCKDAEDRKDLVQEIVIQLWKSFAHYNSEFKYTTWIYRIALNVAISFYRKENSRKKIANEISNSLFVLPEPENAGEHEAKLNLLNQFIAELKELDKALVLLYLEEKSYREIAEIIGITETNVATKLGRIKIWLKQKFEKINQL